MKNIIFHAKISTPFCSQPRFAMALCLHPNLFTSTFFSHKWHDFVIVSPGKAATNPVFPFRLSLRQKKPETDEITH